jgi:23S rRNA U2552 (ribose-2'-O)-methylase RlmE/FtsJ
MSYYILPNVRLFDISNRFEIFFSRDEQISCINKNLNEYLNAVKMQISDYDGKWDTYKKYTNSYEYIHSSIPNTKQSVCKLKPLSRSFFKMIEINLMLQITEDLPINCFSFHLAEGPGGFIEALSHLRNNLGDTYHGMTLQDENPNVPGWKKTELFLTNNPNVIIENGADGTGDLMNKENLIHCYQKYGGKMDLITADGGFDFSIDFNKQETNSIKLIYSQICFAIAMQKKNGCLILKMFDIFTEPTIELLFILSCIYKKVYVSKPHTSRCANSEKYIICKNFILDDVSHIIPKLLLNYDNLNDAALNLTKIINIEVPYLFINKVEEINAIFGQQQIENICHTINLIENHKPEKLETFKKTNISKCINWCHKHQLPYNKKIQSSNMFLSQRNNSDNSD